MHVVENHFADCLNATDGRTGLQISGDHPSDQERCGRSDEPPGEGFEN